MARCWFMPHTCPELPLEHAKPVVACACMPSPARTAQQCTLPQEASRHCEIAVGGPWREASLPRAPVLIHRQQIPPILDKCCSRLGHGSREKLGRHKRNHGVLSLVLSRILALNVPYQPNAANCILSAVHTRANQTKATARATGPTGWLSACLSLKL